MDYDGVTEIQVGETYAVSAYHKKTMIEIEQFKHEDGRMLNTEVGWRNGTFIIRVEDEDEREALQNTIGEDGAEWDYEEYSNIEMDSTFDGCWEEFVHYGNHFTEDEQEALEEEYEAICESDDWQSRYEFLEERGFDSWGCNWVITNGTYIEIAENKLDPLEE